MKSADLSFNLQRGDFFRLSAILILVVYFCFLMHIPLFNIGGFGNGVDLPQNMLAWVVISFVVVCAAILSPWRKKNITPALWLFLTGVSLLTFPAYWCPEHEWFQESLPRLCALWGCVIFFGALQQCQFNDKHKYALLWCVTLSSLVESLNVFPGIFYPQMLSELGQRFFSVNGRGALGIFQQINVTASFLATGLAVCFYLYSESFISERSKTKWNGYLPKLYLLSAMLFLSCAIVLTKSRIGWIGSGVTFLIAMASPLLISRERRQLMFWKNYSALVVSPVVGGAIGIFLLDTSVLQSIAHEGSNHQRWLTLKTTWEMIKIHPYAGWGLGSFRMQFQHFLASGYQPNPSRELMGHPHNELLYVWVEGGIVALCGIFILAAATGYLLWNNLTYPRLLLWSAMLPILMHTMVEFPLYYSVAHVITLMVIILTLDTPASLQPAGDEVSPGQIAVIMNILLRLLIILFCGCVVFWTVTSMYAGNQLSHYEEQSLENPDSIRNLYVPWLQRSRYEHDLITLKLYDFWITGNSKYLDEFLLQNERWLQTEVEPDSYINQVDVLKYLKNKKEACYYFEGGRRVFPYDRRFSSGSDCSDEYY